MTPGILTRLSCKRVRHSITALACVALLSACWGDTSQERAESLPALAAKSDQTSVSGISSGAYMAGQYEMAFAKSVVGAAIIAGGPYGCAESVFADSMPGIGTPMLNLSKAVNGCMLNLLGAWGVADPAALARKARRRARKGQIGPIEEVVTDRVYLFSGKEDRTVKPAIVKAAAQFYADLGVPKDNIELIMNVGAGHAFVTEDSGLACGKSDEPYIEDCDYDQARALLAHIYGEIKDGSETLSGETLIFDQRPFIKNPNRTGLAEHGVVYIPQWCRNGECRIHVAFHGCSQNRSKIGDAFIEGSGFRPLADTNDLIVLFPQVETTPVNPQGCWDWWGYTGSEFLTRKARQMVAVYAMVGHLAAPIGSQLPELGDAAQK